MIGLGWRWDELVLMVGPHIGYSMWTADYSRKPMSATDRVNIGMADVGLEATFHFDEKTGFWAGAGTSTMDANRVEFRLGFGY